MVESMAALVLADQLLQHVAQCRTLPFDEDTFPEVSIHTCADVFPIMCL